jgi:hypothetical protein
MPDPLLILKAMGVAAVVAAATLGIICMPRGPASMGRSGAARSIAIGLSFLAGCWMLGTTPRWPPKDALGRLFCIVLPLAVIVEYWLAMLRVSPRIAWPVRAVLTLASARVLLDGSVYLTGDGPSRWSAMEASLHFGIATAVVVLTWFALQRYSDRRNDVFPFMLIAMTILGAGIAIMLSGYATGGQLAMPLAAAIVGGVAVSWFVKTPTTGAIGVGYLLMCCLLFIGKHFAELSMLHAILIATAPLWCWLTELPRIRNWPSWIKNLLAGLVVAVPIASVLVSLQRQFVEKSGPAGSSVEPSISDYYK